MQSHVIGLLHSSLVRPMQRGNSAKISRTDAAVAAQDAAVQGQALFNMRDSNKVFVSHLDRCFFMIGWSDL